MRSFQRWVVVACLIPLVACGSAPKEVEQTDKPLVEKDQPRKAVDPLTGDQNAQAGHKALAESNWKAAIAAYDRAIQANPAAWQLRMNKAIALSHVPDFEKAMGEMQLAADAGGRSDWQFWFNLGNLYQNRGMYEESVSAYRAALSLHQGPHIDTLLNLGSGYLFTQRYAEAKQTFDYVIELAPRDPRPHHNNALIFQMQKLYPQALEAYEQVHLIDPNFAQAYFNKADMLGGGMGRNAEGIAAFERYIQLEPNGPYVERAKRRIEMLRSAQQPRR